MAKVYLIWLDILGFDNFCRQIAESRGLEPKKVRTDFIETINERIEEATSKQQIIGQKYGESDDWLLATNSLDLTLKTVGDILEHDTGYLAVKIPLEIAIGAVNIDDLSSLQGSQLLSNQGTIDFLKTNIISFYHKWHELEFACSPKKTFVVITEDVATEMEINLRNQSRKIIQKRTNDQIIFYSVEPILIQQQHKIMNFLEKIGRSNSKLYNRIDDLFIAPTEFEEIKASLKINHLVFITGTAEYGKTYTAVRLLWEYFLRGYEVVWIEGREQKERSEVRKRLEEIERELKPRHIIYFEDPFGKISYERAESLEREVGYIINCVKNIQDAYIVLTSREEVFKEFERENLSSIELQEFEKKLNIKKPSYDYYKRKEMLLKWAEAKNCIWLQNPCTTTVILSSLQNPKNLPTPLSIRDFAVTSSNLNDITSINQQLREKSVETVRSFAKELEYMSSEKFLFLLIPFVDAFPITIARSEFNLIAKSLNIDDPNCFEETFSWFKDDKIDVKDDKIVFSHPSYNEAVRYSLAEKQQNVFARKNILSKLLNSLVCKQRSAISVAQFIRVNYDLLESNLVETITLQLTDMAQPPAESIYSLIENYDKLPIRIKEKIPVLARKPETSSYVAFAVLENIRRIPYSLAEEILVDMAKDSYADQKLAYALRVKFHEIPSELLNKLLLILVKKSSLSSFSMNMLNEYGYYLPTNLIDVIFMDMIEFPKYWEDLSWLLKGYFERISPDIRILVLIRLLKKVISEKSKKNKLKSLKNNEKEDFVLETCLTFIARVIGEYFNIIEPEIQKDLICKLSGIKANRQVAMILLQNFPTVSKRSNLDLLKIIESVSINPSIPSLLRKNYDTLPVDLREALLGVLTNEQIDSDTVAIFEEHSNEISQLLIDRYHSILKDVPAEGSIR
jgi:hypothetical protein